MMGPREGKGRIREGKVNVQSRKETSSKVKFIE